MKKQYRHGDVFLEETSQKVDSNLQKSKTNKIALGEATKHAHKLAPTGFVFTAKSQPHWGNMVSIPIETPLSHEEHKTIVLPPSTYKVTHQRTFSKVGIHKVLD